MKNIFSLTGSAALALALVMPTESAARACGGSGQKPCSVFQSDFWEIGDFCEDGLSHIPFTVCAPKIDSAEVARVTGDIAVLVGEIVLAFNPVAGPVPTLIGLLDDLDPRNQNDILRIKEIIESDPRFDRTYRLMRRLGMNTMTVGFAGGGALIAGGGGEAGVSLDTSKANNAYAYGSSFTSIGLQVNAGIDLVISGFIPDNVCIEDGVAIGSSAYIDAGPGGGIVMWHDEAGNFLGFSVPVGVGGIGGGIATVRAKTQVFGASCDTSPTDVIVLPPPGVVPEPPAPEPEPDLYTVVAGDSLWQIAQATYGDGAAYPRIHAANAAAIADPDLIFPDQTLLLPPA